jgi:peptidoglycan-associated lipoprotein
MKKIIKSAPFIVFVLIIMLSSCAKRNYYKGVNAFNQLQYSKSNYYLKKAVEDKKGGDDAIRKLADGYKLTNQTKRAEAMYGKLVKSKRLSQQAATSDMLNYAKMLMANEKYEDAANWFHVYDSLQNGADTTARILKHSCDSIALFSRDSALYTVVDAGIRGIGERFGAVYFADGIVFTAEVQSIDKNAKKNPWNGAGYLDMYFTYKDSTTENEYAKATPLKGKVNSPFHDGPCCFNPSQTKMFFTRNNVIVGKDKLKKNTLMENNLKMYEADLSGTTWGNIKELSFSSDDYSVMHPSMSADGKQLYFASDRKGGFGGTDIYVVDFDESTGKFGEPLNLGASINTAGNELFPSIAADSNLYFSSNNHSTMGGLDINYALWDGQNWSKVTNMGAPINSSKDDYCFIVNPNSDEFGYISSNRTGKDRIYEYTRNEPILYVDGKVTDRTTGEGIPNATVLIKNDLDGTSFTTKTDENGYYFFDEILCRSNYSIQVSKNMWIGNKDVLRTLKEKRRIGYVVNLTMKQVEINKPIALRNIYYVFNKWFIKKDAGRTLDSLTKMLKDNPEIEIELSSHTDARGKARYNLWLSDRRASSAVYYLRKKGIDKRRLTARGYGESVIINKCKDGVKCTDAEHQQNRRTEFKITKVNKTPLPAPTVYVHKRK